MILISHRGNLNGPQQSKENSPAYIEKAMAAGFDVEVDVWYSDEKFFLGHDCPQYEISIEFLKDDRLWCHAKNIESLKIMLREGVHCFWHQQDHYTFTSDGCIWAYPGEEVGEGTICVMPEGCNYAEDELLRCMGICSDYVARYSSFREGEKNEISMATNTVNGDK
jgi:hypothetical protein